MNETLAQIAKWITDVGYPLAVTMPDDPPPAPLWEAIVDHVYADAGGRWHGNELTRDEVDDWLRAEAGIR